MSGPGWRRRRGLVGLALAAGGLAGAPAAGEPAAPADDRGLGYSVGYQVGSDFRRQAVAIDPQVVVRGVRDALARAQPAIPAEEMRAALAEVRRQAEAAARRQREEEALGRLEAGRAFLARNRGREGVTALASGLQYEVLEAGRGPRPGPTSRVRVHYRGTLLDGTEFDSSWARGEPASFGLDGVIAGWREALPRMPEGSRWRLFVPPELAYGERGAGRRIPPNSTLVFEVELLSAKAE